MKIIGHRGAAGLSLENTLSSIKLAKLLGVDQIEFDVRQTKDKKLVLCHDADLSRISHSSKKLSLSTYAELQKIPLYDVDSRIPLLEEALDLAGDTPVIIEIKETGLVRNLLKILEKYPGTTVTVVSFKLDELALLRGLRPEMNLYGLHGTHAVEGIHLARILTLDGIGLKFWLLNPLTYWIAKRNNLSIYVYTVNNRFIGRFIGFFYPKVAICTDHPEWFKKPVLPGIKSVERKK